MRETWVVEFDACPETMWELDGPPVAQGAAVPAIHHNTLAQANSRLGAASILR